MDIESFRELCIQMEGATEEFPFGNDTLVFKVGGKVFALAGLDEFTQINIKCDPEEAVELRERYPAGIPGYHMNKTHWNTILMDHSVSDSLLREWIINSYDLVKPKVRTKVARPPVQRKSSKAVPKKKSARPTAKKKK